MADVDARHSGRTTEGSGRERSESGDRAEPGRPIRAALIAWALPGAGHVFLGRRRLGLVFAAIVLASLAIGLSLDGNLHQVVADRPLSVLATIGSMGMGLPYFFLRYMLGYTGDIVASGFEYGSAFILTAGLMNLLLVLDSWDIAVGRKR